MSTNPKQIREEKLFAGGMDSDSSHNFVIKGDYLYARNMSKGDDGDNGVLVNIKGTKKIDDTFSFVGEYSKVLGSCTDWDNDSSIVFVYDGGDGGVSHYILKVDIEADTITKIVDDDILNFNPNYLIQANVIDGVLYWTDNYNPPRKINIERALGNDGSYTTIDEQILNVAKVPPLYHIGWSTGYDINSASNNVTGKLFQFREKYIYDDYEESVWGNTSESIFLADNYKSLYIPTGDYDDDNYIRISFNSGHETVTNIKIAARNSLTSDFYEIIDIDKNNPINVYYWDGGDYVLKTIPLDDDTNYVYYFYNNNAKIGLDQEKVAKHYDRVPRLARSQDIFGNRLGYGGCTLGYDKPDVPTMSLIPSYSEFNPNRWMNYIDGTAEAGYVIDGNPNPNYFEVTYSFSLSFIPDIVTPHTIAGFDVEIKAQPDGYSEQTVLFAVSYDNDDYMTKSAYISALRNKILTVADECSNGSNGIFGIVIRTDTLAPGGTNVNINSIVDDTKFQEQVYEVKKSIKKGIAQIYGIEYSDKHGVKFPIVLGSAVGTKIKKLSQLGDTHRGAVSMGWTLAGTPPIDAYYYQWVVGSDSYCSDFIQMVVKDVKAIEGDDINYALDVSSMVLFDDANKQVLNYNFEPEDRIILLKQGDSTGFKNSTYIDWSMDVKVLDVRDSIIINGDSEPTAGLWLVIADPIIDYWSRANALVGTNNFLNSLIEIYKPTKEIGEKRFYEIGEMYSISNAGESNRVFSKTSGNFGSLHKWIRTREFNDSTGKKFPVLIEASSFDDFSGTEMDGSGRFNIEEKIDRDKYQNDVRWSGKWYEDTLVNGLSTFDWDSKVELTDKYGKINNIIEVGTVLKVVTDRKIFSLYVGARVLKNSDGSENVTSSQDVIGTVRPSSGDYGSLFASSILNVGSHLYGYDINSGVVWRDSPNGTFPISGKISTGGYEYDYKMHDYIRNKSNILKSSGISNVNVYTGYDNGLKVVYFAFVDKTDSGNNEVLLFHEPSNRWIGVVDLNGGSDEYNDWVQCFSQIGNYMISANNNCIWKHNDSSVDRCNIYGHQKDYEIKFTANINSNRIKIFNNIGIYSNKEWEASLIEIPINMNYHRGMVSRLKKGKFSLHEGAFRAAFLRNMKTSSDEESKLDLLSGEELRGQFMDITLKGDSTDKVELFKVDIDSELSR